MGMNKKLRWLPEVIDDMIDFCDKNGLEESRLGLLHVRTVMLEELALEQHSEEPDHLDEASSDSDASSDSKIFHLRNTN